MDSETQYQGFHGGGMSRDHTPIILPLYYPKGACAGRRYRPVAKGASSKHLGAHLEYLEGGGVLVWTQIEDFLGSHAQAFSDRSYELRIACDPGSDSAFSCYSVPSPRMGPTFSHGL